MSIGSGTGGYRPDANQNMGSRPGFQQGNSTGFQAPDVPQQRKSDGTGSSASWIDATYDLESARRMDSEGDDALPARLGRCVWRFAKEPVFIVSIAIILFIMCFLRPFLIPSGSMVPTLVENDRIICIACYWVDGHTYQPGDIVCFHEPDTGTVFIKRIVANGGSLVEIKGDELFINGERAPDELQGIGTGNKTGTWQLADDEYFMMGDNRQNSKDSRYIGPIKADRIIGKAYVTYWPLPRIKYLY